MILRVSKILELAENTKKIRRGIGDDDDDSVVLYYSDPNSLSWAFLEINRLTFRKLR